MAVGADEAAVQTDIRGIKGRDHLQLGGCQVILADAVLLVEQIQHPQLHTVAVLAVAQRTAAHKNIQRLTGNGLVEGLLPLFTAQMRQQIIDDELGLVALAQHHGHRRAVLQGYHTPQLQGDRHPLVLADAAVVMGLAVGQLAVLINGMRLQIQTGRVDVAGHDLCALGQALPADHGQHHALLPVHPVHPVAGLQGHAPLIGDKARRLRQRHGVGRALPLGLAVVQKALVVPAIGLHGIQRLLVHPVIAVLAAGKQQLSFGLHFIGHCSCPPSVIWWSCRSRSRKKISAFSRNASGVSS